jgi:HlyD family secretion protein
MPDKNIESEVISQKRKKTIFIVSLVVVSIITGAFLLRSSFASSIRKSAITTAVVERGNIENTLNASGEVLPEFEEVITSPIASAVKSVQLDAGTTVKTGQSVLTLDKSSAETEYQRLKFLLESKQNEVRKLKLQLDKSYFDIKSNNTIKQLRINNLEADVENAKRLYKAGGATREDIEKAELALKIARQEKLQLENEEKSKQQTMEVEMREAGIGAAIQLNELRELERKLKLANVVANRDGVVTWVNKNIGTAIQEGEALARIADLSSFKVQGSISDNHIDELQNGMPAMVRVNDTTLLGTVTNIQPSVQNGIITFNVQLNERNNAMLRPNMKVDVFLVTASQQDALIVKNGPAFKGTATQDIFIISKDGKAKRQQVSVGMSNFDYVEIKNNVKPGDVIIISDMSKYKNSKEITLN